MRSKTSNQGFIAIVTVTVFGFLAAIFVASSSGRAYVQARNIEEIRIQEILRFNAISCVAVARQKIHLRETLIAGEYFVPGGRCQIESLVIRPEIIYLTVSAENTESGLVFRVTLDRASLAIISLL